MKPVVLVTRKLPAAVEDRLRRDYRRGSIPMTPLLQRRADRERCWRRRDPSMSHRALLGAGHRTPPQDRAHHRELLSGI